MKELNDGGPAFPRTMSEYEKVTGHDGMSLRDWFAGQALTSLEQFFYRSEHALSEGDAPQIAKMAYAIADAMLAEREAVAT